ncbi:hypothetical protein NQ318_004590 [Aromia moschata]|uniref:Retrotransposon gag domain-containing protein n=1 Tax=Aromia moschata TaxID=1265417 RepID=A0AAV8XSN9_9CUCU|nr:hypothetical protein NQ318_004590 [Aromia moschata]
MVNTRSTRYDEETTTMDVSEILKFLQQGRQEDERRRQEDREEAERRHQEICESQQVINTRLNAFSGRIDGENREEIERRLERKLEDTKRQVQKEILEKIEGLEHQLHRTSITDSGDCSTSPATPLQNSTLMHAERGQALEILQSIPEEQQNDYDRIVGALEIRYGHKYLRQVYQSQIKSRQQRTNESLQEYEADIERLIHLAYPQAPKEFLEQIGIQTFIDGLLDTEMQQALRLGRHTTISDVLVAALEFKAAKEASRNYKPLVRQIKVAMQRETQDAQVREMSDQHLFVDSMMNESVISRNKNRSICVDVMDRLKEFYLYSILRKIPAMNC